MKKFMTYIFVLMVGVLLGVFANRTYILHHIKKDIELNQREEFRTPLNDEYTDKKIYMHNYFIREFLDNSNEKLTKL